MQIRSSLIIGSLGALVACGGGGGDGTPDAPAKDIGFTKPTKSLKANNETAPDKWVETGPADLSCLNTPASDVATTVAVTINTTVRDFQSDNLVPGSTVTLFNGQDPNMVLDTATADGNAELSLTLPVGTTRFGYKMTDPSSLDTLLLNQTVDPNLAVQDVTEIASVSKTTAQTLPALIGVSRTPGTGVLAGAMRDCGNNEVSNFIATVSSTSGAVNHVPGTDTYYFSSSVGLPVRHGQKAAGSEDGLFMIIELQPTATAFVQVWGYRDDAALAADNLEMIAELQTEVVADTVITGSYEPVRL